VIHQITAERVRPWWILRRGYAQGRSNARRMRLDDASRRRVAAHQLVEVGRKPGLLVNHGDGWAGVLDETARRAGHFSTVAALLRRRPDAC
jgi:hypothetical protein